MERKHLKAQYNGPEKEHRVSIMSCEVQLQAVHETVAGPDEQEHTPEFVP